MQQQHTTTVAGVWDKHRYNNVWRWWLVRPASRLGRIYIKHAALVAGENPDTHPELITKVNEIIEYLLQQRFIY